MRMKRALAGMIALLLCLSCLADGLPCGFAQEYVEDAMILPEVASDSETVTADLDLPDNEELFAGYVDRKMYGYDWAPFGIMARERLRPSEQFLYDYLKPKISLVAEGKLDCTVFEFSAAALNANGIRTAWSKNDLGGVELVAGNEFREEAKQLLKAAFFEQLDMHELLMALLSDCPYEMYWNNKTISYGWSFSGTRNTIQIDSLTIRLPVAAAFSVGTNNTQTDTTKTAAASQAAAKAQQIISKYAGCSDYDKLLGYKKEICDLVTYDHAAADSSNGFAQNSNPWQMIHVFDGNPSTNVVCEGYSKAFQYLCDLSVFAGDVTCCSVVGWMDGGAHMWNIVTLAGQNYLADITNSDTGSIGQNGGLFLAGTQQGSVTAGYHFPVGSKSLYFAYKEDQMNLWGTGQNSILKLAEEGYNPSSPQEPEEKPVPAAKADLSGDGSVDEKDAVYLLWHVLMPQLFPVNETLELDLDGVNGVTDADALELLWYVIWK